MSPLDEDDALLQPKRHECIVARQITRLDEPYQIKVAEAMARPKTEVAGKNIAEYIFRKLELPEPERFHVASLAKHRRQDGSCGCR